MVGPFDTRLEEAQDSKEEGRDSSQPTLLPASIPDQKL